MIRIWFNHWFSTSYGIIELLKQNSEYYIIASNKQIDSVIQKVCDEWYQDSLADGEEYINYCLDFCREHKIDIFIPRRKMVDISKNISLFEQIGVKVLVEDIKLMELLNDKARTYEYLKDIPGISIPDYFIVNNVDQFKAAYKSLKQKYEQVCVKFVHDEGAMSYRRIVESQDKFSRLKVYSGAEITYQAYLEALSEVNSFDDLMVMPYLPGNEISIDCLNTVEGLIAVPRYKGSSRHENVKYDADILRLAKDIMDYTGLKYPCNIQFKIREGKPYLLEINTRMSGGLQMSCLAADINIPDIAVKKLQGINEKWTLNNKDCVVSYIEIPQIIR